MYNFCCFPVDPVLNSPEYYHYSCTDVQFGVEDLHTYAHLLSVALNSKLCQGRVADAVEIGTLSW